jgi:hypothetical protein
MFFLPPFILAFCILSTASCAGEPASNTDEIPISEAANRNKPVQTTFDNPEEFLALVELKYEPVDVIWKDEPLQAGGDQGGITRKFLAVFRLDPSDANALASELAKGSEPKAVEIDIAQWFPTELVTQSELGGTSSLKGLEYSATSLIKEPFSSGRLIRIEETDYFVLELFAK